MENKFNRPKEIPEKIKDERKAFVNYILDRVKSGKGIWEKKWDISVLQPERQDTGTQYKGKNRYKLGIKTAGKGYNDNRWYTYNQVQELRKKLNNKDIHVKKGEKSTVVDYWKFESKKELQEEYIKAAKKAKALAEGVDDYRKIVLKIEDFNEINEKVNERLGGKSKVFQFQSSYVFNAAQIENLSPKKIERKNLAEHEIEDMIDTLIDSSKTPVKFAMQEKAFYSKTEDKITLPTRESFESERHCLATLLHEMGHAHASKNKNPSEKEDSYAIEELKAEFTSLFVQSELGINLAAESVLDNSAEYIKAWGEELLNNPSILDNVIKDAQNRSTEIVEEYKAVLLEEKVMGFFDGKAVEEVPETKQPEKNEEQVEKGEEIKEVAEAKEAIRQDTEKLSAEEISEIVKKIEAGLKVNYLYGTPEDNDLLLEEALAAADNKKRNQKINDIDNFIEFNGKRFFISMMEPIELPNEKLHLTKTEVATIEKDGIKNFIESNKEMLQKKFEPQVKEFIRKQADEFWDRKVPAFGKNSEWSDEKEYVKAKLRLFFRDTYADENFKGQNREKKVVKVNFEPLVQRAFEERKAALTDGNAKTNKETKARTN